MIYVRNGGEYTTVSYLFFSVNLGIVNDKGGTKRLSVGGASGGRERIICGRGRGGP